MLMQLYLLLLSVILLLKTINTAPINSNDVNIENTTIITEVEGRAAPAATTTTISPIQQWFENLTRNQTVFENSLQDLQKWFANLSGNSDTNNPFGNILGGNGDGSANQPIMILGSYQAVKIPLPQITDIIKNLNNFNQLMQGNIGKLPQLIQQ